MKKKAAVFISTFLFGALSFIIFNPLCAQPENWPQFRGINCAGLSAEGQNPPVHFGPDKNILWKVNLPEGHSSPCIWGNYIFITGFEEEGKLLIMFCIDRNDGSIRWEENISVEEFEKVNSVSNPATATPATDGERVYFYFSSYGLLCYDFNGDQQWKLPIPVPKSRHGMGTSPIVTGDLVILNCIGHQNDPRLLAINKYDGSTVWKHSLPEQDNYRGDSYSTPVIYKDRVIIYGSEYVAAYNIKTGDRIWRFLTGITDAVCTPVIGNDILYTVSYSTYGNPDMRAQFPGFNEVAKEYDENGDFLLDKLEVKDFRFLIYPEMPEVSGSMSLASKMVFGMVDKNKDELIDSLEWKINNEYLESFYEKQGLKAIKLGGEGDINLDYFLWGNPDQVPHISSPLYYNNNVYIIKSGGTISCFHAESGRLLYREKLGASGAYFSSPIVSNGRIYIASRNGIVTVLEAGDKLNILTQNDLEDKIMATPAVVDNKLYIRTTESLYAFGE
ncbi:PQQ-binding-like beta-propeller repeat protein [Bacteroidota bacterium]